MTMRTPNIELLPTDEIMICPADADRLGLANGERVRMVSAHGNATLPVKITEKVRHGKLFATFHDPTVFLNYATSPVRDRFTLAPEFKVTAVRLEKLGE